MAFCFARSAPSLRPYTHTYPRAAAGAIPPTPLPKKGEQSTVQVVVDDLGFGGAYGGGEVVEGL